MYIFTEKGGTLQQQALPSLLVRTENHCYDSHDEQSDLVARGSQIMQLCSKTTNTETADNKSSFIVTTPNNMKVNDN